MTKGARTADGRRPRTCLPRRYNDPFTNLLGQTSEREEFFWKKKGGGGSSTQDICGGSGPMRTKKKSDWCGVGGGEGERRSRGVKTIL